MDLLPCTRCRRHIDARATACPFCAVPRANLIRSLVDAGGRLSRAAVFAGVAACYTNPPPPQQVQQVQEQPPPPPPDGTATGGGFAQPPPDGTTPAQGTGTIEGTVLDGQTRAPVAGVIVILQGEAGSQVQADAAGHFVFKGVAPGRHYVSTQGNGNPRQPPPAVAAIVSPGQVANVDVLTQVYVPDRGPCCKPYGAPPARRRVV